MSALASQKFGNDDRYKSKFVDLGVRLVKVGSIKQSIDWVTLTDVEMLSNVFGELDFVKQICLWSDKCGVNEVAKLEEDYKTELRSKKQTSKINLLRYLKGGTKKEKSKDGPAEQPNDGDNAQKQDCDEPE